MEKVGEETVKPTCAAASDKVAWLSQLKEGSLVWWNDPDDGICSGAYAVTKVPEDASQDDCMFTIENEQASIAEVPGHELCELGPKVSAPASVQVEHWASDLYRANSGRVRALEPVFEFEIEDKRASSGQAWLSLASRDSHVDDLLAVCMEVNSLGDDTATQTAHVHFDSDNLAFSVFKRGDRYLLRPEAGVTLERTTLPSGEVVWEVR